MISSASSGSSSTRRIRLISIPLVRTPRQREVEGRAAVDHPFAPHTATVPFDDPPHGGQTDAGPIELLARMQALEDAEQFFRVRHVESDTVVAYVHHRFTVRSVLRIDLDARGRARRREL